MSTYDPGAYGRSKQRMKAKLKAKAKKKAKYVKRSEIPAKTPKSYGQRIGSLLGEGAEKLLPMVADKFLTPLIMGGLGDYAPVPFARNIKSNTLAKGGMDPPTIQNSRMQSVIIRHREYLGDLISSATPGAFSLTSYNINPGLPEAFPWLSQISTCFEQWKPRGIIFEFKSTSADALNSTNTALGSVIMATNYDATRPNFTSKQQMENHQYASSTKPSHSMLHPVECAKNRNVLGELYVRAGTNPQDLRFTDLGVFQIATVGMQASVVNLGEIYITYELEFLTPIFTQQSGGGEAYLGHMSISNGVTTAAPLGTNVLTGGTNMTGNLGLTATGLTTVQFPSWIELGAQFLVLYTVNGTAGAALAVPTITPFGFSSMAAFTQDTNSLVGGYNPLTTGAGTSIVMLVMLKVTSQSPSFTITGGTFPGGIVGMDLFVVSYPPGFQMDIEEDEEEEVNDKLAMLLARIQQLEASAAPPALVAPPPAPSPSDSVRISDDLRERIMKRLSETPKI